MNIEIMRNTLYKAYLEDFYQFCQVRADCYIKNIRTQYHYMYVYIHMSKALFLSYAMCNIFIFN